MKNETLLYALEATRGKFLPLSDACEYTHCSALAVVEPLIHEVAHAAALGLRFDPKTPDRVSRRFDGINFRNKALGLVHEAHALVIERRVLRRLGWLQLIQFDRFVENIRRTGWSGPSLPSKTLQSVMRALGRDESINTQVYDAIAVLERIAQEEG